MPASLKNGNRGTRGGKRKGAGRKPGPIAAAKRKLQQTHEADAEEMYRLVLAIARDRRQKTEVRLDAAREVMNRVWGKPTEEVKHTGEVAHRISIKDWATEPPVGVSPKRPTGSH